MQSSHGIGDLRSALGDITCIRRQMANSMEFRGYGPATLFATGVLATMAAGVQAVWVPDAARHPVRYLAVWLGTAVLSAGLIGLEMFQRTRRIHSGMADEMIRMAVEQFLPAVVAGFLVTLVVVKWVPGVMWMLPGVWQVIYSLGVMSACRFLPRQIALAGVWYLLSGLTAISLGGERALAPWVMGLGFGVGQALVAGILLVAGYRDEGLEAAEVGDEE